MDLQIHSFQTLLVKHFYSIFDARNSYLFTKLLHEVITKTTSYKIQSRFHKKTLKNKTPTRLQPIPPSPQTPPLIFTNTTKTSLQPIPPTRPPFYQFFKITTFFHFPK